MSLAFFGSGGFGLLLSSCCERSPHCSVALALRAAVIYDGWIPASSADLLVQGNWPIYQEQEWICWPRERRRKRRRR